MIINKQELEKKLANQNTSMYLLCKEIYTNETTFRHKMDGKSNFSSKEILDICNFLKIDFQNCGEILELSEKINFQIDYFCEFKSLGQADCSPEPDFEFECVLSLGESTILANYSTTIRTHNFFVNLYAEKGLIKVGYSHNISDALKFKTFNEATYFKKFVEELNEYFFVRIVNYENSTDLSLFKPNDFSNCEIHSLKEFNRLYISPDELDELFSELLSEGKNLC